ncbi:MAG: helix-turn-helix domain-containing protein [Proteobacteria bacterium]|nr:helix-turn-helix domain-containing protein [Pseudomonadota bacterium]
MTFESLLGFEKHLVQKRLERKSYHLEQKGRYIILREIGRGGMGIVYLARHGFLKKVTSIHGTKDAQQERLVELLARHRGNVSHVAAELGASRMQVYRWLKKYSLDPKSYRF